MKTYSAAVIVTLSSGRLKLTPDQARTRAHNLTPVNATSGVYEIVKPVQFKRGESFGYDGDIPKAMAGELMSPEQVKVAVAAKAKEEKKARAKADETEAAARQKAEAMDEAVAEADKAVAAARKVLEGLGDKADPDQKQAIERTIEAMGIVADAGDLDGFKDAIAALVEQTGWLKQ